MDSVEFLNISFRSHYHLLWFQLSSVIFIGTIVYSTIKSYFTKMISADMLCYMGFCHTITSIEALIITKGGSG